MQAKFNLKNEGNVNEKIFTQLVKSPPHLTFFNGPPVICIFEFNWPIMAHTQILLEDTVFATSGELKNETTMLEQSD